MPVPGTSYSDFEAFLNSAESIYSTQLTALNSSGVSGSAIAAVGAMNDDGTQYINVAITVTGMEANAPVPQTTFPSPLPPCE